MTHKISERQEAWFRIVVLIISGIVLGIWRYLIVVLIIINWICVIFSGKRNKDFADLCEVWNSQAYVFLRYIGFVSNERPFPFNKLSKKISKFK